MCGIWKLTQQRLDLPSTEKKPAEEEIVLRLNDDGSFDPYTPEPEADDSLNEPHDLHSILSRGGCWEYRDESLILAADRPGSTDSTKVHDTLLMGKLVAHVSECLAADDQSFISNDEDDGGEVVDVASEDEKNDDIDVHLTIPQGQVSVGKFMYPKKHKAFFDEPVLFKRSNVGSFCMNQLLGNLNTRLKSERDEPKAPPAKYHKKDFHNRTFYLTATPHPVNQYYAEQDVHYDESKAVLDIRVMPITFHSNNTFSAIGTEKVLRGRYGISGEKRDRLWFQVSLFGFGRSAPGSIFSEGRLLSHDDRRGYAGPIQEYEKNNQTMFFVKGLYYYGTDLRNTFAPTSMGTFALQEIDDALVESEEDDETDDDDALSKYRDALDLSWDSEEDSFQ